jgi:hypothetical protein
LALRRDAIRWLRERRAQLYVGLLTEAHAEQAYLAFVTSSDTAREQMHEAFAATDTQLSPLERARLGASGAVFGSQQVTGLYDLFIAEAWPVSLYPGRFRSDEARMRVLGRTAGILGELEMAVRRELGADRSQPEIRPPGGSSPRAYGPRG